MPKASSKPRPKPAQTPTTSRKDAETDALFLSIGEGTIATDEHGNISRINDVALKILGYTREELMGKWYPEAIIGEDERGNRIPNLERPITQVFLMGKSIFKKIYYRRKDGSRVPVALTVSPILLDGNPIGAVEVFRDITEEVELENSKDEFISIASHQLRTPATVVKQYLGMLLDGYIGKLSEAQLSVLTTAYEYNDHQLDTINDLLKVAQADSHKTKVVRKRTDLVKLIKSVISAQQDSYRQKNMSLTFVPPATKTVFLHVDPLHIRMVVENLVDNARKYSPENTSVEVGLQVKKDCVSICVKDQGFGIPAGDLPKLFQKFSRLNHPDSSASGTGLGLYWAKKLIDLHGGTLDVTSKPNKGTTFTIEIPLGGQA